MIKLFNIPTATAALSVLLVINSVGIKSARANLPPIELDLTQSSTILAQSFIRANQPMQGLWKIKWSMDGFL